MGKYKFKRRSTMMPPLNLSPAIQTFFNVTRRDIMALRTDVHAAKNLSNEEKTALRTLKGENVVIWPTNMYLQEAHHQLGDNTYYCKLPSDPTQIFKKKLDRLLEAARGYGILTKQELDFLTVPYPVIPTFYIVPKIHKNAQTPPGRPIVAGIGGLCEHACVYIDHFLQPLVLDLPWYLRDSTSVLQEFAEIRCEGQMYLVTCDVEALYSNIKAQHGMTAIIHFFSKIIEPHVRFLHY